jgi:hypothetical protein
MPDDTCHKIFQWELKDILQSAGEYSSSLALDPTDPGADIFLLTPSEKPISYFTYRVYNISTGSLRHSIPYKTYRFTEVP